VKSDNTLRITGSVIDVLPNATFKVKLETNTTVLAYLSGKMRQNEIRILLGDNVDVELSVYDLTKGRIVRRH
jgi:translation initiation factor IF-1